MHPPGPILPHTPSPASPLATESPHPGKVTHRCGTLVDFYTRCGGISLSLADLTTESTVHPYKEVRTKNPPRLPMTGAGLCARKTGKE